MYVTESTVKVAQYIVTQLVSKFAVTRKRRSFLAIAAIAALFVGGCATPKSKPKPAEVLPKLAIEVVAQPLQEELVAKDLIYVLRQLAHPATTTIQLPTERDNFESLLLTELILEGYGIQQVQADQGANFINYERVPKVLGNSVENTYILSVGDIGIQRRYDLREYGAQFPVSPITLAGSRIAAKIDRSLFTHLGRTTVAVDNIRFTSAQQPDEGIPTISLITSDVVSGIADRATGSPSLQGINSSNVEINNLFFEDDSNFSSVLDGSVRLSRDIVPFGDDELRLGKFGKRMVIAILNDFDERTDFLSVVGCSNGPTSSKLGNEGLALGRAARITEEFRSYGVARDKILDEGCWAPQSVKDRFPSRGVIVELWRRNAS